MSGSDPYAISVQTGQAFITAFLDRDTGHSDIFHGGDPAGPTVAGGTLVYAGRRPDPDPVNPNDWAKVGQIGSTGWQTLTSTRGGQVQLAYRGDARPDDPMINPGLSSDEAHWRLRAWYLLTGLPYSHTPGHVATTAMIESLRGRARLDASSMTTGEKWAPPAQISDIRWNPPGHRGPATRWDMRSAYLAAAAAVTLPRGRLQHTGIDVLISDTVGYYRIKVARGSIANLLGPTDRQGTIWVCHPTGRQMLDQGMALEIHDSWTVPEGNAARLLRGWAEQWRDYLYTPGLDPAMALVLKRGYAEAIGLLNVAHGALQRPDWRHMIIDQARASMLRRIHRGYTDYAAMPVRVDVDSIWYAEFAVAPWLGEGAKIGNMRFEGTDTL